MVVIGGGTGTHTVLRGLKHYQEQIDISAIVTMADSGGSTGRLRDEFGYLPVGDVRMALTALASDVDEHEELMRELFLYRFDKGDGLSGHSFGNLLLVALTDILGSEEKAIRAAGKILRVEGKVEPVTNDKVSLVAKYEDGVEVVGEHCIDEPEESRRNSRIFSLSLSPKASITESARQTILEADLIILGPGDLYTSVLANCVVEGVSEVFKETRAKIVYVCNLMTKLGQTDGMKASDHVGEITKYIDRNVDYLFFNNQKLPEDLRSRYAKDGEFKVELGDVNQSCEIIEMDLLATEAVHNAKGDTLKRSLIRHDSDKLAKKLVEIL